MHIQIQIYLYIEKRKYHTIRTGPKFKSKITETRGIVGVTNTHTHNCPSSYIGTDISIKSGGAILVLFINIYFFIFASSVMLAWFGIMVLNATFNNISVISWRSVSLVEETGENHRPVHKSLEVYWNKTTKGEIKRLNR